MRRPTDDNMKIAPLPVNEAKRLKRLRGLNLLDTPPEEAFDAITDLAAAICKTPIALVSLVDRERQWFKARLGLDATETSRHVAFCAHTILQPALMEVPDALEDERFRDNPLVQLDPAIRFYAGVPLITADGSALGTLCVIDRTSRRLNDFQRDSLRRLARTATALCESRKVRAAQLALILGESFDEVYLLGATTLRIMHANERACRHLGYDFAVLCQMHINEICADSLDTDLNALVQRARKRPPRPVVFETRLTRRDSSSYAAEVRMQVHLDEDPPVILLLVNDVSSRKAEESRLLHLSTRDSLTGLVNRQFFEDRLATAIARARRGQQGALVYLDVDQLKAINDHLGHEAGDALLVEFARRLQRGVRPSDTVARIGGDEFAIVLEDLRDPSDADTVAQHILDALAEPTVVGEANLPLSASIGIAYFDQNAPDLKTLVRQADSAMYAAKQAGRGKYHVHRQAA